MQKPSIASVDIKKEGRFWAVKTDNKLLAIVLYKQGAVAVQGLLQQLCGIKPELPEPKKDLLHKKVTKVASPKATSGAKKKPGVKPAPAAVSPSAEEPTTTGA